MLQFFAAILLLVGVLMGDVALSEPQAPAVLPPALERAVVQHYPGAKVEANSTVCKSSADGVSQIGIVIHVGGDGNPRRAIVAVAKGEVWEFFDLPRRVENSRGFMADFLADEPVEPLEVRCTTPEIDKEINSLANGEFVLEGAGVAEVRKASSGHVCFAADVSFDSWACYWVAPNTMKPVLSFVQINAD